jgi:hypothetical protein
VNDLRDGSTDHIAAALANLHPILAKAWVSQYINITRFFVVHHTYGFDVAKIQKIIQTEEDLEINISKGCLRYVIFRV